VYAQGIAALLYGALPQKHSVSKQETDCRLSQKHTYKLLEFVGHSATTSVPIACVTLGSPFDLAAACVLPNVVWHPPRLTANVEEPQHVD